MCVTTTTTTAATTEAEAEAGAAAKAGALSTMLAMIASVTLLSGKQERLVHSLLKDPKQKQKTPSLCARRDSMHPTIPAPLRVIACCGPRTLLLNVRDSQAGLQGQLKSKSTARGHCRKAFVDQ